MLVNQYDTVEITVVSFTVDKGTHAHRRICAEYIFAPHDDHRGLVEALKAAEKLQHHNSKLFNTINRTEGKLCAMAKRIAIEVKQIEKRNQRSKA